MENVNSVAQSPSRCSMLFGDQGSAVDVSPDEAVPEIWEPDLQDRFLAFDPPMNGRCQPGDLPLGPRNICFISSLSARRESLALSFSSFVLSFASFYLPLFLATGMNTDS